MNIKVLFLAFFFAFVAVSAKPQIDPHAVPPKYNFNWEVNEPEFDNYFGQTEERDGDQTSGSYFVVLPDGQRQEVSYRVEGDSGFIVDIQHV